MVNKVIIQGRFVATPEVKNVGGFDMSEFTVAWSEKIKEKESKCFLRCKVWREQAQFVSKNFVKGQEVVIEGKLNTEEWEKDGQKQSRTICNVERVNFCGSKASNNSVQTSAPTDGFMDIPASVEEELPFN